MTDRQPNDRLASLMREAALSHKALARAVRDTAVRQGANASCDHTSVSRWLSGMQPREATAKLLAEALSARLHRRVTLNELGMEQPSSEGFGVGLEYPENADETAVVLARLWRADLDDVTGIMSTAPEAGAWAKASLRWLVRPDDDPLPARTTGRRIGAQDLIAIKATIAAFSNLDGHFGGGHGRAALISYLHTDLLPMLRGQFPEAVGRELFSAAAEAQLQAAWMTYDAGRHALAQRYFLQALRLAQGADNVLLAASVLDAMSHQATFLGHYDEAAELARSARVGTRGAAAQLLTAHFLAMEARAVAASGDSQGTMRLLSQAAQMFERGQRDGDPEWISYFDEAELNAEFGHCFRDIGRGHEAAEYAGKALTAARGVSARSDFFVTMVQADGLLAAGEVEHGCSTAAAALALGRTIKSARCVEYVSAFRKRMAPHATTPAYRRLEELAHGHPLWTDDHQNGRH